MGTHEGLTQRQAMSRLQQYGENILTQKKKSRVGKIFFGQFRDTMIVILLLCTVVSLLLGEYSEAITVICIVLLNALLGFIQEFRTEKTLERLGAMSAPTAVVVREGSIKKISASGVVPGDIVRLSAGDRVPADGRLLVGSSLSCDESMLSGESAAIEKLPGGNERVFMGTLVQRGSGIAEITATGKNTEMGKIAGMLGEIQPAKTPLQKRLGELGRYIGVGCLLICAGVAVLGVLRGEELFDMLLTGISLAVAAVPEGLPAIVTIALALSVGRMVRRQALVRRLHAVETLGCATVICSDKTGTLTQNKMTVKYIRTLGEKLSAGECGKKGATPSAAASALYQIAALCNNATFTGRKGEAVFGEPTEVALLRFAKIAGVTKESSGLRVIGENPFDSTRKRMSVVVEGKGERLLLCKGAPEQLLTHCTTVLGDDGVIRPLTKSTRERLESEISLMAAGALRVLGFAQRAMLPGEQTASAGNQTLEENLCFVGLCGLFDPPRKEAKTAVRRCKEAGVRTVMITGDYELTARAIAAELSIFSPGDRVVSGSELLAMSEQELLEALPHVSVFARVTPGDKLRIVRGLQALGEVVAMTGDGVNDAPAVSAADIGVSMGNTGTDVTKEAAAVILLDDNFATLVAAVEEGRVIYQNIRKFIRYLLSCNIGEVFTMVFSMLAGMPIPLLPIQILFINLVTDGLPAIALGLENGEREVMQEPPRGVRESVFSRGLSFTIVVRGLLIGITTVAAFSMVLLSGGSLETARTVAMVTLILSQLVHVFECKSERKSLFRLNLFDNLWLVMAVLVSVVALYFALYNPFFALVFDTVPLSTALLLHAGAFCGMVPLGAAVARLLFPGKRHGFQKKTKIDDDFCKVSPYTESKSCAIMRSK